jgi:hypothetical protein
MLLDYKYQPPCYRHYTVFIHFSKLVEELLQTMEETGKYEIYCFIYISCFIHIIYSVSEKARRKV